MSKPRQALLIISRSDLAADPRVNRQIRFLKDHYQISAAGLASPQLDGVEFIQDPGECAEQFWPWLIDRGLFLLRRYDTYYWRQPWVQTLYSRLQHLRPALIIANDPITLPLALRCAGTAPVLFDAHEYSPLEFEDLWWFRLYYQSYITHLCRRYIPHTAAMTTVCETIARRYQTEFGVLPTLIFNAPDREALAPRTESHTSGRIRLLHHGGATPSRKIEVMIDLIKHLDDRFDLTLMLVPKTSPYVSELRQRAGGNPRIIFREPVPMRELARVSNEYDLGLFLLPPTNYNYRYALPNKFFEFIQGRIGIAIGPSPEMAGLVKQHDLGVVADDFTPQALARRLNVLTSADIQRFRFNADRVAQHYSAEAARDTLQKLVARLLQQRAEVTAAA